MNGFMYLLTSILTTFLIFVINVKTFEIQLVNIPSFKIPKPKKTAEISKVFYNLANSYADDILHESIKFHDTIENKLRAVDGKKFDEEEFIKFNKQQYLNYMNALEAIQKLYDKTSGFLKHLL